MVEGTTTGPAGRAGTNPYLGLRHLSWVRVVLTESGPVCEVAGVGHRLPAVRRVPLATATALAARGVPTVVRGGPNVPPLA